MSSDVVNALRRRTERLREALEPLLDGPSDELQRAADALGEALAGGGTVFLCGNGGSAAQALHLEAELMVRYREDRAALPAVCLGASGPAATATANDYAAEELFARQLGALGGPDDVLLALSTSGRSPNVLRCLERARELGLATVLLTGPAPEAPADVVLRVDGASADEIQDGHQLVIHALMDAVEARLSEA